MAADPMIQYWVNYGGAMKPEGTVHRIGCDWAGKGHGRWLTPEDLVIEQPKAADCKKCGGRYVDG